jgi:hypothetical protein
MNNEIAPHRPWIDFFALIFALLGAIVSVGGAVLVYISQLQFGQTPLWLLPGFVLLDWAILGLVCFLTIFLNIRQYSIKWLEATLFITGTFVPLIVLGAFSIGPLVLIGFMFFLISTLIQSFRQKVKWLKSFGLFLFGLICNLGFLLIIIFLGNLNY